MNEILRKQSLPHDLNLQLVEGDITRQEVDAVVNAANAQLQHGGGVAKAIAEGGGPTIQRESDRWIKENGPISHAEPAYTSGGSLPAEYVIHVVGPVWGQGEEESRLQTTITGALKMADQLGVNTLALPAISTGVYGFPLDQAVQIILQAVKDFDQSHPKTPLDTIRLVVYGPRAAETAARIWDGR